MAVLPNGGSWLTHLTVLVIYLAGNVTKKTLVGSHFPLLSPPVFFLFFHLAYHCLCVPASLTTPTCFSSLIIQSCVKLSVPHSPGNRLTFALGYCSHLLALKYLNIQNPTLHLRHGQISAGTISHLSPECMTMWSAFMNMSCFFFFLHSRCWSRATEQTCTMAGVALVHVGLSSIT